jgi:chromosome segregation ATPase
MKEIATQAEQIKYLEEKCEEYLKKIAEKEEKLRENEVYYVEKIDSIIREGERRMQEMEWKMVERKKLNKNLLGQNEELKSKLRDYDRSPYDLYEQGNQYDNKMKIERPIESSYRKTGREGHGKTTIE